MAVTSNRDGTFNVPAIMKDLHKTVDETMQDCAHELLTLLVKTNPVDRSERADEYVSKDEWIVALQTYTGAMLSSSKGKGGLSGSIGGAGIDLVDAKKSGRIRKQTSQGGDIDSFDSTQHNAITIFNPAPYMAKLNDGYSPQAQQHWIEWCVDQVISNRGG